MPTLTEQTAVITGASSGIGAATARRLAAEGAAVVLAARRADRLRDLRAAIEADGGRARVVATDVTDRAAVGRLVEQAHDAFGRVDILVNNAGIMPLSFMKHLHEDEWERMVDVNLKGVLYGVAAVLPGMMAQRRGHIVNVSSVAGRRVFPGGAVYAATKHAVRALSEGLRRELAPVFNIRVTDVQPGVVATELTGAITDEELLPQFRARTNFTPMQPEDIARAVHYAVTAPAHVDVAEVLIMPSAQPT
jgi:NADP-dependent 3-hydroxy acid dehydrogenase YdfG